MSGNSSATGGYLTPNIPYPLDDDSLDALLQGLVVGCTGLDGSLVRPRWQAAAPKQPPTNVNWCAIGVMTFDPDDGPWIAYDPSNDVGLYYRHETLNVVATFYGPNAGQYAGILRDGLAIPQNTDVLRANAMAYVACGTIRNAPELVNEVWRKRKDMPITLRRKITRSYQIHYIGIAAIHTLDDTTVDNTIVVPPGSPWSP